MKIEDIEIKDNTLIHKIEHSFIKIENNKQKIFKGNTEYTIIDETGKEQPKKIIKSEN